MQKKYSTVIFLTSLLLVSVAQAGGKFTVVNNEKIPITITVEPRIHCYQSEPKSIVNKEILPGESYEWSWWHANEWRGCGGTAGEFAIKFDPPFETTDKSGKVVKKERVAYWFDRGDGFGPLDVDDFPGKFSSVGGAKKFTTAAGFKGITKLLSNQLIIIDYIDGNRSSGTDSELALTEAESNQIEKDARTKVSADAEYEGAGAKVSGSVEHETQQKMKADKMKEKQEKLKQRDSWKMTPDRIKIGMYTADIYQSYDGSVSAIKRDGNTTYKEYNLKEDRAEMLKLAGAYSIEGAIGLLPGLKVVNVWDNSDLQKVELADNAGQPATSSGMSKSPGINGIPANVQAACENGKGTAYFFQGANYWRYYPNTGKVEGPIAISSGWAGLPDNLDAAVNGTNGKLYFFQNGSYWRWDIESDTLDEGHPKAISGGWSGLPDRLDGAMRVPGTKNLLFFAVDKVWGWDMSTDTLSSNARSAASDFPGFPQPIDACSTLGKSTSSFFQGGSVWTK